MLIGSIELALSHVGSSSVIIRDDVAYYPPMDVEICVCVDGKSEKKTVYLPNGIREGSSRVQYL